jgi:mannose-6-phosphate isomerase-like protein (cupin superfamily)
VITVATETAPVHTGDAIPIQLNEQHAIENTGGAPLELLTIGVSRDNTRRVDSVDVPVPRRREN